MGSGPPGSRSGSGPPGGPRGSGPSSDNPCFDVVPEPIRDLVGGLLLTIADFIHGNFETLDSLGRSVTDTDVEDLDDFEMLTMGMVNVVAVVVHVHFQWIGDNLEGILAYLHSLEWWEFSLAMECR